MKKAIGIDLGGTQLRGCVIDQSGKILKELNQPTLAQRGPDAVIADLKKMIDTLTEGESISGIGIGSPGPLHNGIIHNPPNLPGWSAIPLVEILQQSFDLPVYLENDANVAALAEACLGAGKNEESVFYITVSTGIGGGYVLNRQLIKGAKNCAGEIGNMIVSSNGPLLPGLNRGSLESLASGQAIGKRGVQLLQVANGAKTVFQLANEGNPIAKQIIDDAINYLSIGIANIIQTVNPNIIILGGGVIQSQPHILSKLTTQIDSYVYSYLQQSTPLALATLGAQTGTTGSALLTGIFE
ncbi:glucokinase [Seinonella peptonophila]|uniref:Glucokinase n=1 Tax=Seinonella peptonophila TaxID=112248 RepID=A0A1M4ZS81_9BACL|nr:ROK family protein [Seinonella peptonophila]SHF20909.1 glucokinase [Seinonella peptonophila]